MALQGRDVSILTSEDVSRLGPLLCEVQPSQLSLMSPDVVSSSLKAMASCQHIPKRHRVELMQLVIKTFGYETGCLWKSEGCCKERKGLMVCPLISCRNPADWSPEDMEELGPLVLMDDDITSSLPNKVRVFRLTFSFK